MITILSSFLNKKFILFFGFLIVLGSAYYFVSSLKNELENSKKQTETLMNNIAAESSKSKALQDNIEVLESLRIKDQASLTNLKNDVVKNQKNHLVKLSVIKKMGESNHDIKAYLNTSLPVGLDCLLDTECDTKPSVD